MGLLMALCYVALALVGAPVLDGLLFCALFLLSSLGFGFFGHLLNDLADEKQDIASQKPNLVAGRGFSFKALAVAGSATVALAPWALLPTDHFTVALLLAEILLFILYALKPLRLKERDAAGLLADAAYAFVIPAVLVFHATGLRFGVSLPDGLLLVTSIWAFSAGIFNITLHQLIDLESDARSGQQTFAVTQGRATTMRLATKVLLPLHLLGFGVFAAFLSVYLGLWYAILPILLVAGKMSDLRRLLRISVPCTPHALQWLNLHYHRFLPHWNILAASVVDPSNLLLAVFHTVLFHGNELLFWGRKMQNAIAEHVLPIATAPLRFLVNHGIYWFRRIVLRKDELSAHGDYAAQHLAEMEEADRHQRLPHVALVNHNLDKYTETFVRRHLKELPFNMHLLYGGYLPTNAQREGDLISGNPALKAFLRFWATFRRLPANHHQKKGIASYLLRNNISLVLAEFGQSGAEMTPICRELGIPLICIFHGYDAYNVEVLKERSTGYALLFNQASALVAVSKDIRERLIGMGAPLEKIHHLPCAPNPAAFPFSDHAGNRPVVLTVGRFCTNKAPHLSILAFNEILKEIPDARLVMVGDGELREACELLAISLGIWDSVDFAGMLPPEQVLLHMRNARVLLQPSVTGPISGEKEGTPVAVMEAMLCGLPVVATRHGGIADLIEHGETGILVNECDHIALAKAALVMLKEEREAGRMAENATNDLRQRTLIIDNIRMLATLIEANFDQ